MPRQRQRIVFCDCFDCRDRPEVTLTPEQLDAATAVARQEPPPKALLLYATGFVVAADGATNLDSCTLPHCNLVVREGNLGLLAVRQAEKTTDSDPESGPGPSISELTQLLGVYQEVAGRQSSTAGGDVELPSLAARYKGMQAAFASTSVAAQRLAQRLGMAVVDRLCLGSTAGGEDPGTGAAEAADGAHGAAAAAAATAPTVGSAGVKSSYSSLRLPDASGFSRAVSEELGAAEGSSGRDLMMLHLDLSDLMERARRAAPGAAAAASQSGDALQVRTVANEQAAGVSDGGGTDAALAADSDVDARWDAGCEALEWLDLLIRGLLGLPEIRERTLLVLMLSPAGRQLPPVPGQPGGALLQPGGAQLDPAAAVDTPRSLAQVGRGAGAGAAAAGTLSVLDAADLPLVSRPIQSFEVLGLARVEADVRAPVVVARRLPGVVRRDRAERLGYKEAVTAGGMGVILLDRLLPEVAYKIGRAPKYGA